MLEAQIDTTINIFRMDTTIVDFLFYRYAKRTQLVELS